MSKRSRSSRIRHGPPSKRKRAAPDGPAVGKDVTWGFAAEAVLQTVELKEPLPVQEILALIQARFPIEIVAATPLHRLLNGALARDVRASQPKFFRSGPAIYGLISWNPTSEWVPSNGKSAKSSRKKNPRKVKNARKAAQSEVSDSSSSSSSSSSSDEASDEEEEEDSASAAAPLKKPNYGRFNWHDPIIQLLSETGRAMSIHELAVKIVKRWYGGKKPTADPNRNILWCLKSHNRRKQKPTFMIGRLLDASKAVRAAARAIKKPFSGIGATTVVWTKDEDDCSASPSESSSESAEDGEDDEKPRRKSARKPKKSKRTAKSRSKKRSAVRSRRQSPQESSSSDEEGDSSSDSSSESSGESEDTRSSSSRRRRRRGSRSGQHRDGDSMRPVSKKEERRERRQLELQLLRQRQRNEELIEASVGRYYGVDPCSEFPERPVFGFGYENDDHVSEYSSSQRKSTGQDRELMIASPPCLPPPIRAALSTVLRPSQRRALILRTSEMPPPPPSAALPPPALPPSTAPTPLVSVAPPTSAQSALSEDEDEHSDDRSSGSRCSMSTDDEDLAGSSAHGPMGIPADFAAVYESYVQFSRQRAAGEIRRAREEERRRLASVCEEYRMRAEESEAKSQRAISDRASMVAERDVLEGAVSNLTSKVARQLRTIEALREQLGDAIVDDVAKGVSVSDDDAAGQDLTVSHARLQRQVRVLRKQLEAGKADLTSKAAELERLQAWRANTEKIVRDCLQQHRDRSAEEGAVQGMAMRSL